MKTITQIILLSLLFVVQIHSQNAGTDIQIYPTNNTQQAEVSIAVHPLNNQILLVSAMTFIYNPASQLGIGRYVSLDGGKHWTGTDQSPLGSQAIADPVSVIGLNGYMYVAGLNQTSGGKNVIIMRSTNNGTNWSYYTISQPAAGQYLDKPHLISDNRIGSSSSNLCAGWTRISPGYVIEVARSTNYGVTWIDKKVISDGLSTNKNLGVNLQVGPNGYVYACWADLRSIGGEKSIVFNFSTNNGADWGTPFYAIDNIKGIWSNNAHPVLGCRTNSLPVMAVNQQTGRIYIAWVNVGVPGTNTGDPDVYLIYSDNNGVTWSNPKRVNSDPIGNNAIQFHCWLTIDAQSGALYVSYYDNRNNIGTNICEYYVSHSIDNGLSFTDQVVSDVSFNVGAIYHSANYNGEYPGLAALNGAVYPVWHAQYPNNNAQAWISPFKLLTIDQTRNNGSRLVGSNIGRFNGSSFSNYTIQNNPIAITSAVGEDEILLGDQNLSSSPIEKYFNWNNDLSNVSNHHKFTIQPNDFTFTSRFNSATPNITIKNSLENTVATQGIISFKDPWFIDSVDASYSNNLMNRGMADAIWRSRTSPFYPDFTGTFENGKKYNGVFLNQFIEEGLPYYSVKANQTQSINLGGNIGTRNFYFQNWDYDQNMISLQYPNALQTGVVFKQQNAVVQANYKGNLLSNSISGISSNSQRKLVRTDDGIYHIVYESLGDVWYTRSTTTNFFGTYTQDVSLTDNQWQAASPSIDSYGNTVVVTFEYNNNGTTGIAYLENQSSVFPNAFPTSIAAIQSSYFGSAKPVIAITPFERFVCYRISSTGGLKYKRYFTSWSSEQSITGTDANSLNPSIAGKKVISSSKQELHIAYQQSTTEIKYVYVYQNGSSGGGAWSVVSPVSISSGNGYTSNKFPCLSLRKNGSFYDPIVSWSASRKEEQLGKTLGKETDMVWVYKTAIRPKASSWGTFYITGDNVNSSNNNSSFSSNEETVITFSTNTGTNSKWLKRTGSTYSALNNLSNSGSQIQVSNGSGLNQIKSFAFDISGIPYSLNKVTTSFDNVGKISLGEQPTYGRTGVVYKNRIEFVFNFGEILLDGQNILFTERSDTLPIASIAELNKAMQTNIFTLNSNSKLYFSVLYYVINKDLADLALSANDRVNFCVELVNTSSNQSVGIFDNVSYSLSNLNEHASIDYQVDCNGITAGEYYFRLVTAADNDAQFFLSNVQNDREGLGKKHYQSVAFNQMPTPKFYLLEQNYPNPFNPTTTINYQIKEDGLVTLKLYDILGEEIRTLVNEAKNKGRYTYNFNDSDLASGVYIYQIRINDFVSSKKLMLLK